MNMAANSKENSKVDEAGGGVISGDRPNPLEQELQLYSQANEEFKKENYDACLKTLVQLEEVSGNKSQKIELNRSVVRFYKSECKDYVEFLKSLDEIDKEEATAEKSRNNPSSSRISQANLLLKYNRAVVYFHRRLYQKALEVLTPIVNKMEILDKNQALLVGALYLRLLLDTQQPRRAQAFLEMMQSTLKLNFEEEEATSKDIKVAGTSEEDLNGPYRLIAMLTNVLNRKAVIVPEESAEFSALKARQYYIMKDFQMASKQLAKINATNNIPNGLQDRELSTCIANNMGVIHLRVRHYALAANFFQYALDFNKDYVQNFKKLKLQQMSSVHTLEILINLGISLLHLRKPHEAFQCFVKSLDMYHSNPRLWLRIAEACIMVYEMKQAEEEQKVVVSLINAAQTKQMPKPVHKMRGIPYNKDRSSAAFPEPTLEFASLSLRNALFLTKLYREKYHTSVEKAEESTEASPSISTEPPDWHCVLDNNFCNPSKPPSKESLDNLLAAVYAASSYVSLRLGDYMVANTMAQDLLNMDSISDAYKMLGHMYKGEALIMLEHLVEATHHLDPKYVASLNQFDFETKHWQVKSLDAAQNIVRYNLAVAMLLQADIETAKSLIATCNHPIVASKIVELKMYIDVTMKDKGMQFCW